jgi:hypothetical protein
MGTNNQTLINQILASLVAAASIASPAVAHTSKVGTPKAPAIGRGANVERLAGHCPVGSFPQTSKAGPYNALCNQMPDAEKCLAFIKQHFNDTDGVVTETEDVDRMSYCLAELEAVLGAAPTP